MVPVFRWRKSNGLTQIDAAALLGVSQPYLSLLEKGARPLTAALRDRMKFASGKLEPAALEDRFRSQLSALGYPGFAHIARSRTRPRPSGLLMAVLARPDIDARIVEALPWLARAHQKQLDFGSLIRQAKLRNLQNRLGFVLRAAGVETPDGLDAIRELERARLLQEDTLCWDSMPAATRKWLRSKRTPLARHWNVLTMLSATGVRLER